MKSIRHFIWDFDGTLFDTYPVIIENLREALGEAGRTVDAAEAMRLMLRDIPTACRFYCGRFGLDEKEVWARYGLCHARANAELAARPIAGVSAVLRRICETGRANYIFTHRDPDETRAYLKKYGLVPEFREIVSTKQGFALKPSPEAVNYLLEQYAMKKEEAVMVGDREIDLGSGRAAGICTAHLVCAVAPETLVCDWRLHDYGEMLALL